ARGAVLFIVSPCTGTAPAFVNTDPLIIGGTFTETSMSPIDPRPACGSAAYSNVDPVPNGDSFFSPTTYKGAFGNVNWLDGWSFFNLPNRPGFVSSTFTCPSAAGRDHSVALCGTLSADKMLYSGALYVLTCQMFVPSGITLGIQAGVTIYASLVAAGGGGAPALIIEKGGFLLAKGSATMPITFTAFNPTVSSNSSVSTDTTSTDTVVETRGKWGGLILLGNAPTNVATTTTIEGITAKTYGGTNPTDSSGSMQYVRVGHGGAVVGANNEINGITFGGVGSGTVVDHCEVAFNADDGFEFFGGTVDVKYLSVLFVIDDAFDTDEGYQGRGQYLFAMTGLGGNHGTEMDSMTNGNLNSLPRSHPAFYSMTFIGGGASGRTGGLMRQREGTGGKFGNIVLTNARDIGLLNNDCGAESRTSVLPATSVSIDTYLYFSPNNIINGAATPISFGTGCIAGAFSALTVDPGLTNVPASMLDYRGLSSTFNPLPTATGAACQSAKDAPPNGEHPFFSTVSCKGAFGTSTDNWLAGYSWLACSGKMIGSTCTGIPTTPFATLLDTAAAVGGALSASASWTNTTSYLLAAQLFVQSGVTLTIAAGTSVYGLPVMDTDPAPAIVVLKGGSISASGTFSLPITFTSVLAESALSSSVTVLTDSNENAITLGKCGKWGGLILLGNAPTNAPTTTLVEGITGYSYGGTAPTESSGTLQYVRVWHGGAIVGANNEINGITFGGVGSGTTVAYCEVAYNADDGFEFFGGTVNIKYLSVLFAGDDAFDTDNGYVGKGQFLFAMTGSVGNHGAEMDSRFGSLPRSHPAFYGMTIVGAGALSTRAGNAMMRLREGTGGKFGNMILANATHPGIRIDTCSNSTGSAAPSIVSVLLASTTSLNDYLSFSSNNIIQSPTAGYDIVSPCTGTALTSVNADHRDERTNGSSVLAESALVSLATASTASNENAITLGERGKWGGLILLGNAPTNVATTTQIKGITGYTYGGSKSTESSGSLQYVRVWHGGAVVGANNEINDITFSGVSSGTVADHCDVAYSADDGFEFFSGTVNVKYLSVLFDTDDGYMGKGQFLFALLGAVGNHGAEMDSLYDITPRSHPAFYSMTIIGGGAAGHTDGLMRLREGTGGKFINVHLDNPTNIGVEILQCSSTSWSSNYVITQQLSFVSAPSVLNYLYFGSKNIISGMTSGTGSVFSTENGKCPTQVLSFTAVQTDPLLWLNGRLFVNTQGHQGGMLRPPPTALALAAAATGSAHLDGVVSGALPSAATAHMSLGAAGGLVGEARCDGRDETRTTVIQELIKLLGGLCGSVVAVGTYWYVRQTQRKKRDADTEDTRNMSLRVRGGAPKEKKRAAPLLNAPAQITSKKQKAK
ncbi:lipoprotein, partial [Chrysochromulina tobinii]